MEKCGCKIDSLGLTIQAGLEASSAQSITGYQIIFCPLHAAAGEMLTTLEIIAALPVSNSDYLWDEEAIVARAQAAILKAKGE